MIFKFLQWWQGGPTPSVHVFISEEKRPKGFYPLVRVYFRKWVVHPIKRRVARHWLKTLQRFFGLKVIAITGSTGKTTVKEMTLSVLSQKYKTVASEANIDSVYNIPTTILKAGPSTQMLVLEMGIEFPGEMAFYLWLAKPDTAVLTGISVTHTEFLGSTKGVAQEKKALVRAVENDGDVILNADNKLVLTEKDNVRARVVLYGLTGRTDIKGLNIKTTKSLTTEFTLAIGGKSIHVKLPILGEQNVSNALAAAAIGWINHVPLPQIKEGIESFKPQPHRMIPIQLKSGAWLIDDTYNSNPHAAKRALEVLSGLPAKRKIAVLGEMKELGRLSMSSHRKVGEFAGKLGIDEVLGFGKETTDMVEEARKSGVKKAEYLNTKDDIVRRIKRGTGSGDVILVKGSRSLSMEDIVSALI